MIVTDLVFLSILPIINAIAGRCYLCSQDTLAECIGSNQSDSSIYITVLQYYTEPCNGQCVLFRNENRSIIRGCSWTYGYMAQKSIGWHEISPGIKAYFCNSYLCNNGTYEQPEISKFIFLPQQLFLLATNNPLQIQFNILRARQFHQCYSCTARFQGCGEFLDPHYASKYIRPCPSSCIIFRNPKDLNLITRDCSIFWPQVNVKSGFHKFLGSDAFFCQESLCNGISFDFIMGVFHNQLPAVITLPPIKNISITTTTTTTTTTNIYNDNVIWDDPDLDDDDDVESTTPSLSNDFTSSSITIDYFDDKILPSNDTIIDDSLDLNDTSLSLSSTVISSTIEIDVNRSSILPITRFEYLSVNNKTGAINETDDNILSSTTPTIDLFTFKNQLFDYLETLLTLDIPTFSWMLNLAAQNKNQFQNSTIITTKKQNTTITTTKTPDISYEYCKNKQCHHGGHLNSDCLCICFPTFTGDNCETVLCDEEPAYICAFTLEHECETNYIRYLCPKFCRIDLCIENKI